MSGHSEIVHDYIELRNFLAQSHPNPLVVFDINFRIKDGRLFVVSSINKLAIEVARIQPNYFRLYAPHYGLQFDKYSNALIKYVNQYAKNIEDKAAAQMQIIELSIKHKKTKSLKKAVRAQGKLQCQNTSL